MITMSEATEFGRIIQPPAGVWRGEREKTMEEKLHMDGYILIAWVVTSDHGGRYNEIYGYWMAKTGPRWAYYDYSLGSELRFLGVSRPWFRESREIAKEKIKDLFGRAEDLGFEHAAFALHLLEPGPDRRAAYLRRLTEKGVS
jgi:hypothetical protein